MLIREKDIHPSIRKLIAGMNIPVENTDWLDVKISCGAVVLGCVLSFSLLMFLHYQDALSVVILLASAGVFTGSIAYLNSLWERLRVQRLQQALSELLHREGEMTEAQYAYLQLVVEMIETGGVKNSQWQYLMDMANRLLECALQLEDYQQQLDSPKLTALTESQARLQTKIQQTEDPIARRALEDSLQILNNRIKNRQRASTYLLRLEALRELILQMFGSMRESVLKLKALSAESAEVDADTLYARLSEVQNETRAIEQALQELQEMEQ